MMVLVQKEFADGVINQKFLNSPGCHSVWLAPDIVCKTAQSLNPVACQEIEHVKSTTTKAPYSFLAAPQAVISDDLKKNLRTCHITFHKNVGCLKVISWNSLVLEAYWKNQNWRFFDPEIIQKTRTRVSLILEFFQKMELDVLQFPFFELELEVLKTTR
jgi:hypothetical protein